MAKRDSLRRAEMALREYALGFRDTVEEFPWDHRAFKINKKTFLFLYLGDGYLSLSLKLPVSGKMALTLPFAKPTEYGLGKSGWVTARFEASANVPLEMLMEWVDESFGAIAPRRAVARLESDRADAAQPKPKNPITSKRKWNLKRP